MKEVVLGIKYVYICIRDTDVHFYGWDVCAGFGWDS